MIRLFTTLCLVLLTIRICFANSAIVLISPSAAGPDVQPETYSHPLWVTWPKATDGSGVNQVVSIVTGMNLDVKDSHFVFRARPDDHFYNSAVNSLKQFNLPNELLVSASYIALRDSKSGVDQRILAMASCHFANPEIEEKINPLGNSIYCYRANSWDDVVNVSKQIDGDTIVIEFPPNVDHLWSRLWTFFQGKLKHDDRTGVIKSIYVGSLVGDVKWRAPDQVANPGESQHSGAPDRWLAVGELTMALSIATFCLTWVATFWSLGFLAHERSTLVSRLACYFIVAFILAQRALPQLLIWSGIQLWGMWLILITGGFLVAFIVADLNRKEGFASPLVTIGLPLLVLTGFVNSDASPFGPVYGPSAGISSLQVAFELVFGAYYVLCEKGNSGKMWVLGAASLVIFAFQSTVLFDQTKASFLVYFGLYFFLLKSSVSKAIAVFFFVLGSVGLVYGAKLIVWQPHDMLYSVSETRLNYYDIVRQLLKPEVGIGLLALVSVVAFASRFEFYRLKRTWKESQTVRLLITICPMILLWAVGNPQMLGTLPWAGAFAYLLWSQEALGKL